MKYANYEVLKKKLMKDPAFKKAYEDSELEFSITCQIIEKRLEKGLTQKQLAEKMGTMQPALARFESGRYNPSLAFLKKLSEALGTKLEIKFK